MRDTITCENRVTPIRDAMPLREAALLGCAIPTGAGIIVNAAGVHAGSSVAVFGVGGVGLSALLGATLVNAAPVIAVDVMDHKLATARRLGATHLVNARRQDPLAAIGEITEGRGVDCAIEAAGQRDAMEAAFAAVRDHGGLCVLAGNLPHGQRISLDPFDLIKGKRIVGTWGGESRPDHDLPRFVEWYLAGRLPLGSLITHEYRLEDIDRALADLEQGQVARGLLNLTNGRTRRC